MTCSVLFIPNLLLRDNISMFWSTRIAHSTSKPGLHPVPLSKHPLQKYRISGKDQRIRWWYYLDLGLVWVIKTSKISKVNFLWVENKALWRLECGWFVSFPKTKWQMSELVLDPEKYRVHWLKLGWKKSPAIKPVFISPTVGNVGAQLPMG